MDTVHALASDGSEVWHTDIPQDSEQVSGENNRETQGQRWNANTMNTGGLYPHNHEMVTLRL
jgi:hypothetical protein